jgi:hypothetical protein
MKCGQMASNELCAVRFFKMMDMPPLEFLRLLLVVLSL